MIKVLLWDIDGTILNFERAEEYAIRKCFSIFEMRECTDEMLKRYSMINRKYWESLERQEITKQQVLVGRFQEFFEKEGLPVEKAECFNEEYQKRLGDHIFFNDEGNEIVKGYQGKIKQYIVTNGTKVAQERKLERSELNKAVEGVFISEEVGVEKPNIGFFEKVWDTIGVYDKDEVMIIGDSLTSDMLGGNNAGIKCCWYNPLALPKTNDVRVDYEIRNLHEVEKIIAQES